MNLSPQLKKALKSYARGILAAATSYALTNAANVDPRLSVLVAALAGPAAKYFDKSETDFGKGSK